MAGDDPMQSGTAVRVEVSPKQRDFLLAIFTMARDGAREELRAHRERARAPTRLRREEAAYERLLAGLRHGRLELDPDVPATLRELSEVIDESNEYARVVFEHDALQALIAAVGDAG